MFTIEMLPAKEGDCLWIEYGDKAAPFRILVDAGTAGTYEVLADRIKALPKDQRRFELLVVSHLDGDHIGGAVRLLQERPHGVEFGDVWFNGYKHLVEAAKDKLGVKQALSFSKALEDGEVPWNQAFGMHAITVPDSGALPSVNIQGLKLTVLSPERQNLVALLPWWDVEVERLRKKEEEKEKKKKVTHQAGRAARGS
ncbi:MAG: hypothetical protein JWN34_3251 [Bryobacterales bacterium]|nr:hypothetical protein [Bryobacterales bacterium]